MLADNRWPCGATDKASDYESGVPGSSPGKVVIFCLIKIDFIPNIYCHYYLPQIRRLLAQWKRHLTTNQGIPGSSPGKVVIFLLMLR